MSSSRAKGLKQWCMVYVWTVLEGFTQFHFDTFKGPSWSSFATKLLLYTGGTICLCGFAVLQT